MLPHILRNNFWLKVFSVLLATIFWVEIKYGFQTEDARIQFPSLPVPNRTSLLVPVCTLSAPGEHRAFRIVPAEVSIRVKGGALDLRELSASDIRAYVDLTQLGNVAETECEVMLDAPEGLTILETTPRKVKIVRTGP